MNKRAKKRYFERFYFYLVTNKIKYVLVVLCIFAGIVTGAILSSVSVKENPDNNTMLSFISAFNLQGTEFGEVFKTSILSNFRIIFFIWLSGFFIWLLPLNFAEIIFKGFGIGYTVSYLSSIGGIKGFFLAFVSLFLQNLVWLPCIIVFSVLQINRGLLNQRLRGSASQYKQRKKSLIKSLLQLGIIIVVALLCSLIEGYFVPVMIKPFCLFADFFTTI